MLFQYVMHQYHQFYYDLNQELKMFFNFDFNIENLLYLVYFSYYIKKNYLQSNILFSFNPSAIAFISLLLKLFSIYNIIFQIYY